MPSSEPTPWAVICFEGFIEGTPGCGQVFLTEEEYDAQMMRPDSTWRCPSCGNSSEWDDDNYERAMDDREAREKGGEGGEQT